MTNKPGLRKLSPRLCLALLLGCVGLSGCTGEDSARPKTVPVSGSVKLKGVPAPNVAVTFFAAGKSPRNPTGTTDSQGNFKLTSFDTDDGAVAGDYVVTLALTKSTAGKKPEEMTAQDMIKLGPGGGIKTENTIPEKYADPKSSELKRSVVAGDKNVFNFDLTD